MSLHACLPILRAEEELREGVSDARLYDAVLEATGSEDQASEALAARLAYRMANKQKADI